MNVRPYFTQLFSFSGGWSFVGWTGDCLQESIFVCGSLTISVSWALTETHPFLVHTVCLGRDLGLYWFACNMTKNKRANHMIVLCFSSPVFILSFFISFSLSSSPGGVWRGWEVRGKGEGAGAEGEAKQRLGIYKVFYSRHTLEWKVMGGCLLDPSSLHGS